MPAENNSKHSPTIFVDLDGVLVLHQGPPWYTGLEVLPGVKDTLKKWWNSGAQIIIVTGRPECTRAELVRSLRDEGLYYHQLIMGLTSGNRYLVNDRKPYAEDKNTAIAINVTRNKGLIQWVGDVCE